MQGKYPMRKLPKKQASLLSRREFLALMGLGVGGTMAACSATAVGAYWLLNGEPSGLEAADSLPTPTADGTRLATMKMVERPPIMPRAEWGARDVHHEAVEEFGFYSLDNPEGWRKYEGDLRNAYQTIVIHHSVLYDSDDYATIKAVQNLHIDDRGWADIGYHFCVGQDGTVFEGRQMSARGTHTELYNSGSLGVCLLGNFEVISPTQSQINSTNELVRWLALRLRLTHLAGHRDFNSQTVCPGQNLYELLDEFASQSLLQHGIDGYIPPAEQQITPTAEASARLNKPAGIHSVGNSCDGCCVA